MKTGGCICLFIFISAVSIVMCMDDMLRKSIVFNKARPDIFFCPTKKPKGFDQLYVYARPINKLCEFNGQQPPPDYKSDCYNNIDETEYACKEKQRIMMRIHPPGALNEEEMKKVEEGKLMIKKVTKKKKQ